MKFSERTKRPPGEVPQAEDIQKQIVLTDVRAEFSTGTILERRVGGDSAVYDPAKGKIRMERTVVAMYAPGGALRGETISGGADIYLSDVPSAGRVRRDLVFTGGVRHRNPATDDPTTDSLSLTTERMLWDDKLAVFKGPLPFEARVTTPEGKSSIIAGTRFEASRDLKTWAVGGASTTTGADDGSTGPRPRMAALARGLIDKSEVLAKTAPKPSRPPPLVLPPVSRRR